MKLQSNREIKAFHALRSQKSEIKAIQYLISRGTTAAIAKRDVRRIRSRIKNSNRLSGFSRMVLGAAGVAICTMVMQEIGYLFYLIITIAGIAFISGLYQVLLPTSFDVEQ